MRDRQLESSYGVVAARKWLAVGPTSRQIHPRSIFLLLMRLMMLMVDDKGGICHSDERNTEM